MSWKITILAPRDVVQDALLAHEEVLDWDYDIVLGGCEISEDRPEEWQLEAWMPRKPRADDKRAITALFTGKAPPMSVEQIPDQDWVTETQKGLEPIHAGRFFVHTPSFPPSTEPGIINFEIPAGQAFGTGHHETTAGCLAMLDKMRRQGVMVRNCADVGTGTGILAFAALELWPRAVVTASDIDPVSAAVTMDNARLNAISIGSRGGELTVTIADGMNHPLIKARGPYDLIIANILAGPLVSLAPEFAKSMLPGGSLLLAGLLTTQEQQVRRACRRAGMRMAARATEGDWSILWMRKRPDFALRSRRQLEGTAA